MKVDAPGTLPLLKTASGLCVVKVGIKSVDNGILKLEVRNEMLETHYIDQLEILEITHSPDQLAYPDERGRPLIVGKLLPPSTAVDQSGRDVLYAVRTADDISWSTPNVRLASTSADDLTDHLDFEFKLPADVDDVAMVLRMRNSLLNTVLLYDVMLQQQSFAAIDWMGHDLGHFGNRAELGLWYREHMGLTISVWKNGEYRKVTRIGDQGPIAWSERAVKLPAGDSDTLKVRLSFVTDNWRLIGKLSQPGNSLYGIEHSNEGLITFPGGLPIVDEDGVLVGAIGVSGSTVENDHAVAEAGVKAVGVSDIAAHPFAAMMHLSTP